MGGGELHKKPELAVRHRLYHESPDWVRRGAVYFLTICCARRAVSQLDATEVFARLVEATEFYHRGQKWWCNLLLIMPDHVHALVSFPEGESMAKVVRDWKRFTAKATGVDWQHGFFDHRLRSNESAQEKWHYIRANPVRQGLVEAEDDWPWVWFPELSGG